MAEMLQTKTCARCLRLCSLRRFGWLKRHNRGRDEVHRDAWCADCRKEYKRTPGQKAKASERIRLRRLNDPGFREKQNRDHKAYYDKNKARILGRAKELLAQKCGSANLAYRDNRLRTKFGITLDDYYRISEEQGNRCAICGCYDRTKARALAVDHDHETNVVRALLCHHCNTGLGNFFDNPALLHKAIQYLLKHTKVSEVC